MKHAPIVIVGGGFAGVYTTRALLKKGYEVVLISETNHFTFTPLLHEVATGSLVTHDIVFEYESFFRSPLFRFVRGRLEAVQPEEKTIVVSGVEMAYQDLVIATGSTTNFYDMEENEHCFVLKTAEDALRLKQAIVSFVQNPNRALTLTVVGGGPTGIELIFDIEQMIAEYAKREPDIKSSLRLVHGGAYFCSREDDAIHRYVKQTLDEVGIEVICETFANGIEEGKLHTTAGTFDSDITVLTAGVRPNTDGFGEALVLDERGHILVDEHLRTKTHPNIWALGDVVAYDSGPLPKLAQTAVREAEVLAANIHAVRHAEPLRTYEPTVLGMLFSLGYGRGVGMLFGRRVSGVLAWYLWRTVYLFKTPGLFNKIRVAFSWTMDLFQGRHLSEL